MSGFNVCVCVCSHVQLFASPWTVTLQTPLVIEFFRQEYWSGVWFPTQWDLFDLKKLMFLVSPELVDRFFTTAPPRKPRLNMGIAIY